MHGTPDQRPRLVMLPISRREWLTRTGCGFGALALAGLAAEDGRGEPGRSPDPLAPKAPHFAPKAKRVIFLFMQGGPSHLELFDDKPKLAQFDGTLPPPEL